MPAQSTALSPQQLIELAKATVVAYNDKNFDQARASLTTGFVYDEVATGRKVSSADEAITLWKGWATAFPDSKATFHTAMASGNTAVLEVTWHGTHKGPLQLPKGPVAPTGKRIEIRACICLEFAGDKAKLERQYFDVATMLQQLGVAG